MALEAIAPDGQYFSIDVIYQETKPAIDSLSIDTLGTPLGLGLYYFMRVYAHDNDIYRIVLPDFKNMRLSTYFEQFVNDYGERASAFIIDVRGNSGGNSVLGLDILTYFSNLEDLTQSRTERKIVASNDYEALVEESLSTVNFSKDALLTQPVIILTDWNCGSAGDNFVAYAKDAGRYSIIGTNTRGSTGQLTVYNLSDGSQIQPYSDGSINFPTTAFIGISSNRTFWGDGHEIINQGISPDIWAEQTIEDAIAGVDTVLDFALTELERQNE